MRVVSTPMEMSTTLSATVPTTVPTGALYRLTSFMHYNYTSFYIIEDGSMTTYAIEYFYGEDRRARATSSSLFIMSSLVVASTTVTAALSATIPTESEIKIKIKILQKNKV